MLCSAKTFATVFLVSQFKNKHVSQFNIRLCLTIFSPIILNHLSYNIITEHAHRTCTSTTHIRDLLIQSFYCWKNCRPGSQPIMQPKKKSAKAGHQ